MILLITTDSDFSMKYQKMLKNTGYKTVLAGSSQESIEILKEKREINLVILDMDTVEDISSIITQVQTTPLTPVIYIALNKKIPKELYSQFYNNYLSKESNEFLFLSSVEAVLSLFESFRSCKRKCKSRENIEKISSFGYWEFDFKSGTATASEGFKKIYGLKTEKIPINEVKKYTLPEYRKTLDTAMINLLEKGQSYNVEFEIKNQVTGKITALHSIAEYISESDIVLGIAYDISKQKFSEKNLVKKEKEYQAIFENNHVIMMIVDPTTKEIKNVNSAAVKFYGWTREEMLKMHISDINTLNKEELEKEINLLKTQKKDHSTVGHRISNGEIKDVEVSAGPIRIEEKVLLFVIIKDITQRNESEKIIKKLAYYDSLTNLPNRKSFLDQLEISIKNCEMNGSKIALINIDIDYFKYVNDNFGHHVGDLLLVEIAKRLENNIRKTNCVFRKGGDEFIIIDEDLSQREISKICNRILLQLKNPIEIEGYQIFISSSIGVAIYPNDGNDSETLLKNSDLAMYQSKKDGRNTYNFFSEKIDLETKLKREVESNLRQALINKELNLYYQPKISLSKGEIIGAECLVRWIKYGKVYKSPGEFIPIAESSGLILDLDKYVLTEACRQIEKWGSSDFKNQKISVNISGLHFKQNRIIKTVKDVLKEFKIPKGSIEIEITEGIFLEDMEEAIKTLMTLKSLGFKISVDDFGTGYSSFKYLSQLPINCIKIDKSFILNIPDNQNDVAITKMIISMGKLLNLDVIAEGVETKEQLDFLLENNCNEVQGYYFEKPMPVEKYEEFCRVNNDKIDSLPLLTIR